MSTTLGDSSSPCHRVTPPLPGVQCTLAALAALVAGFHAENQHTTEAMVTDIGALQERSSND